MLDVRKKKQSAFALFVLSATLTWGCARAPQKSIDEATSAFESAKQSEAAAYAPEALASAEDAYSEAMAEVEEQNQKIVFLRSYDRAEMLISTAREAAESATEKADARREDMKRYADSVIKVTQSTVVSARDAVKKLRRGKQEDLNVELETADASLADAEKAWKEGKYMAARDKAEDAKAKADEVLENASAARRG